MPDDTDWVGKGPTPEEKAAGREPRDDGPDMETLRERIMSRDPNYQTDWAALRNEHGFWALPPRTPEEQAELQARMDAWTPEDSARLRERLEDPNRGLNEWQLTAARFSQRRRTPQPAKRKTRGESAEIIAFPTREEPTSRPTPTMTSRAGPGRLSA